MINLALIGTGYWGKKWQGYIEESKDFNLKYAWDSKSTPKWDIDAVIIATPNETHFPLALLALGHDKHVLVEKPLATSVGECNELRRFGKVVMTNYPYEFANLPEGKISSITIKRTDRHKNRNPYWVLGSHALSILNRFTPIDSLEFHNEGGGVIRFDTGHIKVDLQADRETEVVIDGVTYNPDVPHALQIALTQFAKAIRGEIRDNFSLSLSIARILSEVS